MPAFHYAFKIKDIQSTRDFYADILGADLFTIAILTARQVISHRMANADLNESEEAIAAHFAGAFPESNFHRASVHRLRATRAKPWMSIAAY